MTEASAPGGARVVDRDTWPGAAAFDLFRSYDRPHYAVTARIRVGTLRDAGLPVFRTCLWALGAGLHAVPELRMRFAGETVTLHERVRLSPTIAIGESFGFTYLDWDPDRDTFDAHAAHRIAEARDGRSLPPNTAPDAPLAYLSCLPWLDYTALDNALPGPADCIPRVSWGRIVGDGAAADMAVTIQVHHALVHGVHLGAFFAAAQAAFDGLA